MIAGIRGQSMAGIAECDFIIIGGGAAALAAAQYAARSLLQTVVIDGTGRGSAGGQAAEIASLENYPGIFPAVGGAGFIQTMTEQAAHFGARIVHDSAVSLDKVGGVFIVHGQGTEYRAKAVLIATGAAHRTLGVKGERELLGRGVSYCATCDGPFFKGKKIAVIGGGDSALSEALYLASLSPYVTIVHRRGTFRANAMLQNRVHESAIKTQMGQTVLEITGTSDAELKVKALVLKGADGEHTMECDAVFICAGTVPKTELADFLPKDDAGYIKTDSNMQTICPGLFAAGDVRSTPLRQVVTAVSDGAVAATAAAIYVRGLAAPIDAHRT